MIWSRQCAAGSAGTHSRGQARAMPNAPARCGWSRHPTARALAAVWRSSLPPLDIGTDVELVRPAVARLVVQRPIGLGDGAGPDQAVRRPLWHRSVGGREPPMDRRAVDRAVDDQMRDMNILECELARDGLSERAQTEFRCRKSSETGAAA